MLRKAVLALILAALALPAQAAFPDRPIRILVAYAAGGTGDLVGRMVAESLSARLGVPVVVENQGGAGGAIAARSITRAAPDGYNLMLAGNAMFAILPYLTNVGYDPIKGFTAVANISESQRVLAARNSLPVTDMASFVAYAKAHRGALNYGTSGIGSTLHVMTEMLRREAGFEAQHIPFRGSAPAVQAMLSNDIDFMIDTVVIQHVVDGRLRGLAVVGERRLPQLPNLPTLAELGYPNVRTSGWQALMGPPDMPAEIVTLLQNQVEAMLREPANLERLARLGVVPSFRTSAQLAGDLVEDNRQFGAIIRSTGITGE